MISYLRRHEAWAKKTIEKKDGVDWADAIRFHRAEVSVLQSERLAHLIVTMFVGLFLLVSFALVILMPRWETLFVGGTLLILFIAYIRHYFLLENGLQRLYELGLKIEDRKKSEVK
jgi:hypothetical protein